jgi:hypothetical protein
VNDGNVRSVTMTTTADRNSMITGRLSDGGVFRTTAPADASVSSALIDLAHELRISDRIAGRGTRAAIDHLDEQDEREQYSDPDEQALGPGVAGLLFFVVHLVASRRKNVAAPKIGASGPITIRA